jgi:hypothetical protein
VSEERKAAAVVAITVGVIVAAVIVLFGVAGQWLARFVLSGG